MGEHHTMDASLLATNTGVAHNTEAKTVLTVDAKEPTIPQVQFTPFRLYFLYMCTRTSCTVMVIYAQ